MQYIVVATNECLSFVGYLCGSDTRVSQNMDHETWEQCEDV